MLRQDIGFFDSRTSGDLSSRLNSDCGEMAGDLVSCELTLLRFIMLIIFHRNRCDALVILSHYCTFAGLFFPYFTLGALFVRQTWFFRFSIESVVRITGITAYMLLRSPKLGGTSKLRNFVIVTTSSI
jgi:hypothetical protein